MLEESIESSIFRGQNRLIDFWQLHTGLQGQENNDFVWFWWYYTKKTKNISKILASKKFGARQTEHCVLESLITKSTQNECLPGRLRKYAAAD